MGYCIRDGCDCANLSECQLILQEQALQDASSEMMMVGQFVPECQKDGTFAPVQLWGSTGEFFCVDIYSGDRNGLQVVQGNQGLECVENADDIIDILPVEEDLPELDENGCKPGFYFAKWKNACAKKKCTCDFGKAPDLCNVDNKGHECESCQDGYELLREEKICVRASNNSRV